MYFYNDSCSTHGSLQQVAILVIMEDVFLQSLPSVELVDIVVAILVIMEDVFLQP